MPLWILAGSRLWRPKLFPCPIEAPQRPLLWMLTDGAAPSGVQILSQAEARLFSPTLQRLQDMTPLEADKMSRALQRHHSIPYSGGSLTERYPLESKFCPKERHCCFRRPSRGFRMCPSGASGVAASGGRKIFRPLQRHHSIPYSGGSLTERYPLESKLCPKQRQCCFRRPSRDFRT